jgi:hypothetical protein
MDKRYLSKDGTIAWGRLTVGCVRSSEGSLDYFPLLSRISLRASVPKRN